MPEDLLMFGFGSRVWLCTALFLVWGWVLFAKAPGMYVSGRLSATDTEREEQMVAIGNDILVQVRDKAIYDRQIAPLIGSDVDFMLVAK